MDLVFFENELPVNPGVMAVLAEAPIVVIDEIAAEGDNQPVRTEHYVEEVVPRYSPDDFLSHFRMARNIFEQLMQSVGHRANVVPVVQLQKKLLFTIWMLAKPESFRSTCDRFDLSKGTGHFIFHEVVRIICTMMDEEIRWPTLEEARSTETFFFGKYRFPGVIGAIDGCHIPIKAPVNNPIDYYNRNSYHSMVLQGVCNHNMLFIDIFVGMPGRVHDARVFRSSPLHERITEGNEFIRADMHLLGDSAYPLLHNLMVPFRDNGHLTRPQLHYNTILSKCRSKIEQAFGRLKGKWRRLKYLDMDIDNIPYTITAACILHNYVLRRGGIINVEEEVPVHEIEMGHINNDEADANADAVIKRGNLVTLL